MDTSLFQLVGSPVFGHVQAIYALPAVFPRAVLTDTTRPSLLPTSIRDSRLRSVSNFLAYFLQTIFGETEKPPPPPGKRENRLLSLVICESRQDIAIWNRKRLKEKTAKYPPVTPPSVFIRAQKVFSDKCMETCSCHLLWVMFMRFDNGPDAFNNRHGIPNQERNRFPTGREMSQVDQDVAKS